MSEAIPAGWYPDPSGARQWRVWTGVTWSEVTRPYGEPVDTPPFEENLELLLALRRAFGAGIVGVVGGFGLLVGVLAHWPGTAHPEPRWFALAASNAAVALLLVGSVICAFAVRELRGRWTIEAFLPGSQSIRHERARRPASRASTKLACALRDRAAGALRLVVARRSLALRRSPGRRLRRDLVVRRAHRSPERLGDRRARRRVVGPLAPPLAEGVAQSLGDADPALVGLRGVRSGLERVEERRHEVVVAFAQRGGARDVGTDGEDYGLRAREAP